MNKYAQLYDLARAICGNEDMNNERSPLSVDDTGNGYTVYCGDHGTFSIAKFCGEEELTGRGWIYVPGEVYRYQDFSTIYEGYPELRLDAALTLLKSIYNATDTNA